MNQYIGAGAFGNRILDLLSNYTSFPKQILSTQCTRIGLDPERITAGDLSRLAPLLSTAVARFTSREKGEKFTQELIRLGGGTAPAPGVDISSEGTVGPLAKRVLDILGEHTPFAWAILKAQSKRCRIDPAEMSRNDLGVLTPFLVEGLKKFTSAQKGETVRQQLSALSRG